MSEASIQEAMRLDLSRGNVRLFRNHRGKVQDARTGRWHEFGLAPGASDLIGWKTVTITEDMVGQKVAVFTAIEVKASPSSRKTREQKLFVEAVRRAGGLACFAWTVGLARSLLGQGGDED